MGTGLALASGFVLLLVAPVLPFPATPRPPPPPPPPPQLSPPPSRPRPAPLGDYVSDDDEDEVEVEGNGDKAVTPEAGRRGVQLQDQPFVAPAVSPSSPSLGTQGASPTGYEAEDADDEEGDDDDISVSPVPTANRERIPSPSLESPAHSIVVERSPVVATTGAPNASPGGYDGEVESDDGDEEGSMAQERPLVASSACGDGLRPTESPSVAGAAPPGPTEEILAGVTLGVAAAEKRLEEPVPLASTFRPFTNVVNQLTSQVSLWHLDGLCDGQEPKEPKYRAHSHQEESKPSNCE